MIARALALALMLAAPAGAKDPSRVPATGPDILFTEQVLRCASRRVTFQRNPKARTTAVRYEKIGCELSWPQPVDPKPRSVTFTEIIRERLCRARPFRFVECKDG